MKGLDDEQTAEAERKMGRMEAIIHSMTPAERANPDILSPSRKHRIAKGAGVDISEVNRMIKQFNEMKKLMKQFGKPGKKKKFGFPFLNNDIPRIPRYIDSRLYIRRCQRQVLGIRINYEYYDFTEVN